MKQLISSRNIKVVLAIVLAITCINGIGLNLNDHPIQVPDGTSSSQSKTTSTSSIPDYTGLASVVLGRCYPEMVDFWSVFTIYQRFYHLVVVCSTTTDQLPNIFFKVVD